MDVYLKKDFMQYTGSFKERGARYTLLMLPEEQKRILLEWEKRMRS